VSETGPREITQAEAADLLASGFETRRYEPLGLFLVGEAGGTWTGIDNSTGNAWTEEFGTQAECLKWLKGENAVFTLDEAVSRIYELSAEAHMNMARNLKERRTVRRTSRTTRPSSGPLRKCLTSGTRSAWRSTATTTARGRRCTTPPT